MRLAAALVVDAASVRHRDWTGVVHSCVEKASEGRGCGGTETGREGESRRVLLVIAWRRTGGAPLVGQVDPLAAWRARIVSEIGKQGLSAANGLPPLFQPPPPMNEGGRVRNETAGAHLPDVCKPTDDNLGTRRRRSQHAENAGRGRYRADATVRRLWAALAVGSRGSDGAPAVTRRDARSARMACFCKDRRKETIIAVISTAGAPSTPSDTALSSGCAVCPVRLPLVARARRHHDAPSTPRAAEPDGTAVRPRQPAGLNITSPCLDTLST